MRSAGGHFAHHRNGAHANQFAFGFAAAAVEIEKLLRHRFGITARHRPRDRESDRARQAFPIRRFEIVSAAASLEQDAGLHRIDVNGQYSKRRDGRTTGHFPP